MSCAVIGLKVTLLEGQDQCPFQGFLPLSLGSVQTGALQPPYSTGLFLDRPIRWTARAVCVPWTGFTASSSSRVGGLGLTRLLYRAKAADLAGEFGARSDKSPSMRRFGQAGAIRPFMSASYWVSRTVPSRSFGAAKGSSGVRAELHCATGSLKRSLHPALKVPFPSGGHQAPVFGHDGVRVKVSWGHRQTAFCTWHVVDFKQSARTSY